VRSNCQANQETYHHLVKHHCRNGEDAVAEELAAEHDLWCPELGGHIISAQVRKGRLKAVDDVLERIGMKEAVLTLPLQNRENLADRLTVAGGFLIGAASAGDPDLINFYLNKFTFGFKELLTALVELCRTNPSKYKIIMRHITGEKSRKTGHTIHLSKMVRRPIKELLSLEEPRAALDLVVATREHRKPQSFQAMQYRAPVIILDHHLRTMNDIELAWDLLEELELADPAIKVKALSLLYKMQYEAPEDMYRELAKRIHSAHYGGVHNTREIRFLTELMNSKLREAGRDESKLLYIMKTASTLGIRIPAFYPVWKSLLTGLLPTDGYSTASGLVARSFQVKEMLDALIKKEPGYYSNTMVWGFIMQYLLSRETDLTLETAATLTKQLGVVYAPGRWQHNLGKCLFKTKLISAYIDILKVSHKSLLKNKKYQREFYWVCDSLLITLERSAEENINNDELFIDIFTLSWNSGVLFPRGVRDSVIRSLTDKTSADQILAIPALEDSLDNTE